MANNSNEKILRDYQEETSKQDPKSQFIYERNSILNDLNLEEKQFQVLTFYDNPQHSLSDSKFSPKKCHQEAQNKNLILSSNESTSSFNNEFQNSSEIHKNIANLNENDGTSVLSSNEITSIESGGFGQTSHIETNIYDENKSSDIYKSSTYDIDDDYNRLNLNNEYDEFDSNNNLNLNKSTNYFDDSDNSKDEIGFDFIVTSTSLNNKNNLKRINILKQQQQQQHYHQKYNKSSNFGSSDFKLENGKKKKLTSNLGYTLKKSEHHSNCICSICFTLLKDANSNLNNLKFIEQNKLQELNRINSFNDNNKKNIDPFYKYLFLNENLDNLLISNELKNRSNLYRFYSNRLNIDTSLLNNMNKLLNIENNKNINDIKSNLSTPQVVSLSLTNLSNLENNNKTINSQKQKLKRISPNKSRKQRFIKQHIDSLELTSSLSTSYSSISSSSSSLSSFELDDIGPAKSINKNKSKKKKKRKTSSIFNNDLFENMDRVIETPLEKQNTKISNENNNNDKKSKVKDTHRNVNKSKEEPGFIENNHGINDGNTTHAKNLSNNQKSFFENLYSTLEEFISNNKYLIFKLNNSFNLEVNFNENTFFNFKKFSQFIKVSKPLMVNILKSFLMF